MPEFEMRHLSMGARIALMWLAESLVLGLLLAILGSDFIENWLAGLAVVLGLGLLNALLRPILVALSIRPGIWIYGILTWLLDAGLLWLAGRFLPGFAIDGVLTPLLVGFGMGVFTLSFGDLLAIDDDAYYHHVVRNIVHFYGKPEESQKARRALSRDRRPIRTNSVPGAGHGPDADSERLVGFWQPPSDRLGMRPVITNLGQPGRHPAGQQP